MWTNSPVFWKLLEKTCLEKPFFSFILIDYFSAKHQNWNRNHIFLVVVTVYGFYNAYRDVTIKIS